MLKTILAGLRARTARLVLSSIAIALGVAFVTGTLVLGDAVEAQTRDNFARSARNVDASVTMGENSPNQEGGVPAEFLAKVRGVAGVEGADARMRGRTAMLDAAGKAHSTLVQPLATTEKLRDFNLRDGRFPSTAGEAALDVKTAEASKLKVGDELKLLDERDAVHAYTIVGTYRQGASGVALSGSDHLLLTQEGLRQVLPDQRIYEIVAAARPGVPQQQLADDITRAIGPGYVVQTGEQLTRETLSRYGGSGREFETFLLAFAAISLVVAGMVIHNTFTILVAQRTKELALLRCVGADRGQVFRSVLAEAVLMGLAASVLGILGGLGVSAGLQLGLGAVRGPGGDAEVRLPLTWTTVAAGLGVGVLVTVLSAVLPARRATRVAPVAALRSQPDSSGDVARTGGLRLAAAVLSALAGAAGVVLALRGGGGTTAILAAGGGSMALLLAVLLLGPLYVPPVNRLFGRPLRGVPARLASANAGRNPKRTAATTAALMIGVTVVTMVTVVASSGRRAVDEQVEARFPTDYAISTNNYEKPLTRELADGLAKVENVTRVVPEVYAKAKSRHVPFPYVLGYPADAIGSLIPVDTADGRPLPALRDGEIAMNEKAAREAGLVVGSVLDLGGRDFRVVALIKGEDHGTGLVTAASATSLLENPPDGYEKLLVKLAPGADITAARAALESATASAPFAVLNSAAEAKAELNATIDETLLLIWALVGLALVIALFGIANTLTLSVLERTRESSLLRALGLTRGQLRAMLVVESILMTLIGAVTGVLLGTGFGWLLVTAARSDTLRISLSVPAGQLAVLLGLAIAAAVVAAALPARRAARNSVVAGMAEAY
ncbi:ABC transporter permease [Lentzea sp. NPDC060358]|uniref:ABC transporter permease n=1 Tax=Lentzea sp. NPDC060358 TaxID=3347103 RepID=UPI003654DAF3